MENDMQVYRLIQVTATAQGTITRTIKHTDPAALRGKQVELKAKEPAGATCTYEIA